MKISKLNATNEKIKLEYSRYLEYTCLNKLTKTTIASKMSSIRIYEVSTNREDFKTFNEDKGIVFYKNLKERNIQTSTVLKHLRNIKEFFIWYLNKTKSTKLQKEALKTLEPSLEDKRLAQRETSIKEYPNEAELLKIINLPTENILDKLNQAIIAFIITTGARVSAVATATIASINMKKMYFNQDPLLLQIKTKRSKHIITPFMTHNKECYEIFTNWIKYLQDIGFKDNDYLFPRIKKYNNDFEIISSEHITPNNINRIIGQMCTKAGIQKYTAHCFRHATIRIAYNLCQNGYDMKILSKCVGHESIVTLLNAYANPTIEECIERMQKICEHKNYSENLKSISNDELILEFYKRDMMCINSKFLLNKGDDND